MFRQLEVGVVIPAYNEEERLGSTLAGLPAWIDRVIVVDDASRDQTLEVVRKSPRTDIVAVRHPVNQGVGAAICSGYREALRQGVDVTVVMAGDGQMDPADLPGLLAPLVRHEADYVKGNRFAHGSAWRSMPRIRLLGNLGLSYLTRLSSGYRHIVDSQCGYTAITAKALARIDLESVYPRYGFPNDFLAHLHAAGCRVTQVPVRAIYAGEQSGINPLLAVAPLSWVLLRSALVRRRLERRPVGDLMVPADAPAKPVATRLPATGK